MSDEDRTEASEGRADEGTPNEPAAHEGAVETPADTEAVVHTPVVIPPPPAPAGTATQPGGPSTHPSYNPLAIASTALSAIGLFSSCCVGLMGLMVFGVAAAVTAGIALAMTGDEGSGSTNRIIAWIGLGVGIAEILAALLWLAVVLFFLGAGFSSSLLNVR